MKSQLQLFLYSFFVFGTLIFSNKGFSQINFSENFEAETVPWSATQGFTLYDIVPCGGAQSPMVNLYFGTTAAQITSPSIGVSNGGLATLTFQYKLLDYSSSIPTVPTSNAANWGVIKIQYATAAAGPFTEIGEITPATHIESVTCAAKTVSFTPPSGSEVFIRFRSDLGGFNDFFVYYDDVVVTQAAPTACTGTPAAATTIAQRKSLCNGVAASLSLSTGYTDSGLTYQWQKSTDGIVYADIAGATTTTLTSPQTVKTWYKAIVTCTASSLSITSTPVEVMNNGLPCLCEVDFVGDTEPITRVQFAGINNVTSATVNGSPDTEDFTYLPPAEVIAGNTYPIVLEGNTGGAWTDYFKVYIDFNHNGNLNDPGESFEIGTIMGSTGTDGIQALGNITIPATATFGLTHMRVFKLYFASPTDACVSGADPDNSFGQVEDYLVNIVPLCSTVPPPVAVAQSFCSGAVVGDLQTTGGTAVKWYLDAAVGSPLAATIPLVNGTVYYATQTDGCESLTRTAVTVTINTVVVDDLEDVSVCSEYVLPELENGDYYTEPGGEGDMLAAGEVITETRILYVYKEVGETTICSAEDVFTVTVDAVAVADFGDVTACFEYALPVLENGAYYLAPAGEGDVLVAGTVITGNTTVYIYAVSEANPACTAESSFAITINAPVPPSGNNTIEYVTGEDDILLYDVDLEVTGQITWYETEEDALSGENPLPEDMIIPVGTATYYATQTIGECESAPFAVTIDVVLGAKNFDLASFRYYPNPVDDVLNLSYANAITGVSVFNLLGQEVVAKKVNQSDVQVDLSQLAAGTYMVKIQSEDAFKVIKVVKN